VWIDVKIAVTGVKTFAIGARIVVTAAKTAAI
jgi:hypothetical protein